MDNNKILGIRFTDQNQYDFCAEYLNKMEGKNNADKFVMLVNFHKAQTNFIFKNNQLQATLTQLKADKDSLITQIEKLRTDSKTIEFEYDQPQKPEPKQTVPVPEPQTANTTQNKDNILSSILMIALFAYVIFFATCNKLQPTNKDHVNRTDSNVNIVNVDSLAQLTLINVQNLAKKCK